jgi:hypothetical protein
MTGRNSAVPSASPPRPPDECSTSDDSKMASTRRPFAHRSIVMQRLHRDDLVDHVLKQGRWDVLSLPAIAEVDECHLIDGPLGRRFFRRIPGDALHPARESAKSLANEITAPEDEITDDQAMIAYQEWAAIVERIEREIPKNFCCPPAGKIVQR